MLKPTLIAVASLALLGSSAGAQAFRWPVYPAGGKNVRSIVVADFNQDGRPDVAASNYVQQSVSVLLAAPMGGFEAPESVFAGFGPLDLVTADFDLDGLPDIAVVDQLSANLRILRTATGWTDCSTSGPVEAWGIDAGDFDGDGRPDLVAVDALNSKVHLSLTDGSGCPTTPALFATGTRPVGLAVADFDGDGNPDVVTCNETAASVSLLRGDGAGGLLAPTSVPVGAVPRAIVAADLDNDGDADVATANTLAKTISVFLGDGTGGLAAPSSISTGSSRAHGLTTADFDGDGKLDLLPTFDSQPSASLGGFGVLRGLGGGAFAAPVFHFGYLQNLGAIALADVGPDGRLDVLLDLGNDSVAVLDSNGAGGFDLEPSVNFFSSGFASGLRLADMDGDGDTDLLASTGNSQDAGTIYLRLADGTGGFGPSVAQPTGGAPRLTAADVNGDGALDVLGGGPFLSLEASLGDGAGGLAPSISSFVSMLVGKSLTVDLTGDGVLDVVLHQAGPSLLGSTEYYLTAYRGDGAGHFTTPLLTYDYHSQHFGDPPVGSAHAQAGDIDEDGDIDVVHDWNPFLVFLNNGAGGFTTVAAPVFTQMGFGVDPFLLTDVSGDGHLDIVISDGFNLSVWPGNGAAGFGPQTTIAPAYGANSVLRFDVDRDGLLDVVINRPERRTVAVLRSDGLGGFTLSESFYDVPGYALQAGDIDGDGYTDVLASSGSGGISLINQTPQHVWLDLGHALAGTNGDPLLVGQGTLVAGSPGSLTLSHALPNKLCALFISKLSTPAPFKGGLLVPVPPLVSFLMATGPTGSLALSWTHWAGGFPGSTWHFQYAISDPGGPNGVALSNAVRATQP